MKILPLLLALTISAVIYEAFTAYELDIMSMKNKDITMNQNEKIKTKIETYQPKIETDKIEQKESRNIIQEQENERIRIENDKVRAQNELTNLQNQITLNNNEALKNRVYQVTRVESNELIDKPKREEAEKQREWDSLRHAGE